MLRGISKLGRTGGQGGSDYGTTQPRGVPGAWQTVIETRPNEAVRYLGVMVAADGSSEAQTEKVDREVHKRLEQIRHSRCPPGMANYMVTAVVGGLLNYHAPFTRISKTMRRRWVRHILSVLREKRMFGRTWYWGRCIIGKGKVWAGFQLRAALMRQS